MSIVKPDDLFPFEEYRALLKSLENDTESLAQSTAGMVGRIKTAYSSAYKEVHELSEEFSQFSVVQKDADKGIGEYASKVSQATGKLITYRQAHDNLTQAQQANQKLIGELNEKLATLHQRYQSLDPTQKGYEKQQRAILREVSTVSRAIDAQSRSLKIGKTAADAAEGSYQHLSQELNSLRTQLKAMPGAFDLGTGALNRQNKAAVELVEKIGRADAALKKMDAMQGQFGRNVGNYSKSGLAGFGMDFTKELSSPVTSLLSGAGLAAGLTTLAAGIVSVRSEYERLEKQLETTLGNKGAAGEAQKMITEFARKTPREVGEVTKSFNRLVDIGIIPTEKQLYQISDVAEAKGKQMIDYVEAMADAQQGEFERLKEFGINASKSGDQIVFTFKGQQTAVKNTQTAINEYLLSLGNVKGVAGQTEAAGKTLEGRWSALKDTFKQAGNELGTALQPAMNKALDLTQKLADKTMDWATALRMAGQSGGFLSVMQGLINPAMLPQLAADGAVKDAARKNTARRRAARRGEPVPGEGETELDVLRRQQEEQSKKADAQRKAREQAEEAKRKADKILNDNLANSKAGTETKLSELDSNKQDGLISEREFIKQRLAITLSGIDERRAILEKAGKKETDDYKQLAAEKLKIETQSKRDTLKLNLSESKSETGQALSSLSVDKEKGVVSEAEYVERKYALTTAGINDRKLILTKAGLEETQLMKDLNNEKLEADRDYFKERLKVQQDAWKKSLSEVKDGLSTINQTIAADYDNQLRQLERFYAEKAGKIQLDVKAGKLSPEDADVQLHNLRLKQLDDEYQAIVDAYHKDQTLSKAIIDEKIANLETYKSLAIRTPEEIEEAEKAIRDLKKQRDKDAADDKKKLDKEVADNANKKSDENFQHESDNLEKLTEKRRLILQQSLELAGTMGQALFDVRSEYTQKEISDLDKQKENELRLAGDNKDAQEKIEESYSKRKAELQRKAAIQEREAALFSIAINTAQAVMSVLSTGGGAHYLDFGVSAGILSAFVTAAGIAQAAAVLAKPLPAFWTGTTSAPEGLALVGDRGPELRKKRDGSYKYYQNPTVDYLDRGDVIYTASQTSRIVEDWAKQEAARQALQESVLLGATIPKLQEGRREELRIIHEQPAGSQLSKADLTEAFSRALDERPEHVTNFDADGISEGIRKGNNYTEHVEKRRRLFPS